jgi:tRNA U34 5-carboxymethylaminomethyl modifying enzyme MnmG/GidA
MNKEKLQISSDILEYQEEFEVIVVDDGHAGFEAALASARIRSKPSIFYFTQQI